MDNIIIALKDTPLPNILVVAGIFFLLLTVVNQFMGKITIAPDKQKWAGIIGALLLILGIALQVIPLQKVPTQITSQPINTPSEPEIRPPVPHGEPASPKITEPRPDKIGEVKKPAKPGVPPPPVTPKPEPSSPPAPTEKQLQKKPTPNVSGKWNSNIGLIYKLSQNGDSFSWEVTGAVNEKAHGKLDGNTIKVSWNGDQGTGSATGTITNTDSAGRAAKIEWSNGGIFSRMNEQQYKERQYMENTNLLFGDIGILFGNEPSDCEQVCNDNKQCLAWSWVRQGALPQIPRPNLASFCALKKSKDLQKVHDTCCVSGYRQ